MTAISKNVYIDKSDEIADKYNKTYYKTNIYIEYGIEHNSKDPEFKVGDFWKMLKYKNIFAKGYSANFS